VKMNKTFSLDLDLIHQLRSRRNQSDTICRALRLYLGGENEFSLSELRSRQLMAALHARDDISEQLKAVILAELNGGN
jgi:hypothetical protein